MSLTSPGLYLEEKFIRCRGPNLISPWRSNDVCLDSRMKPHLASNFRTRVNETGVASQVLIMIGGAWPLSEVDRYPFIPWQQEFKMRIANRPEALMRIFARRVSLWSPPTVATWTQESRRGMLLIHYSRLCMGARESMIPVSRP